MSLSNFYLNKLNFFHKFQLQHSVKGKECEETFIMQQLYSQKVYYFFHAMTFETT